MACFEPVRAARRTLAASGGPEAREAAAGSLRLPEALHGCAGARQGPLLL